ncbi:MAG: hypothetical protein WCG83_03445 [Candidatus Peregrinibacteria bacterium]
MQKQITPGFWLGVTRARQRAVMCALRILPRSSRSERCGIGAAVTGGHGAT